MSANSENALKGISVGEEENRPEVGLRDVAGEIGQVAELAAAGIKGWDSAWLMRTGHRGGEDGALVAGIVDGRRDRGFGNGEERGRGYERWPMICNHGGPKGFE